MRSIMRSTIGKKIRPAAEAVAAAKKKKQFSLEADGKKKVVRFDDMILIGEDKQ